MARSSEKYNDVLNMMSVPIAILLTETIRDHLDIPGTPAAWQSSTAYRVIGQVPLIVPVDQVATVKDMADP